MPLYHSCPLDACTGSVGGAGGGPTECIGVNTTQVSTTLGHQMSLPGGHCRQYGVIRVGVHLTKHQPDLQADDMSY